MLRKIIKNSGSNASVMIVKICFSFVMAPVIVKALGNYDYGLWEIVFSVVGYMGLMDMGMRPAVVRYVAKFKAENNRNEQEKVFSTAVIFNGSVGFVCCSILFLWAWLRPEILAQTPANTERYVFFLVIIGAQVFFQFPGYIAESFHEGYQRHYLKNNITLINTAVGNSVLYYLLTHGFGLVTLALGNAIGISLKYNIYFILLAQKQYGGFHFSRKNFSPKTLSILVKFGSKTFVQSTASTISSSVTTVIIGFFLGPALVPFYSIPNRLISYSRELSSTITNVFLPVFSHLHATAEKKALRTLYISSTKYIIGLTFPMALGACMLGPAFISRWIGPEYGQKSSILLYILTMAYMLMMMNPLHQRYLTGINRIGFLARIRVLFAISLAVLSSVLVMPLGKEGVALAFLLTSVAIEPYILSYTCKQLGLSTSNFLKSSFLPILLPNLVLVLVLYMIQLKYVLMSYKSIFLTATVTGLMYIVMFVYISMSHLERSVILQKTKTFLLRRRAISNIQGTR